MDQKTEAVAKLINACRSASSLLIMLRENYGPFGHISEEAINLALDTCHEALDLYAASRLDSTVDRLHEELTNEQS